MEVSLADGKVIGWVRERATWCFPVYHVFTPDGQQAFKVRGPFCHFQLCWCADVQFEVLRADSGVKVGNITKKWLGWCREAAMDADHFIVELEDGAGLDVADKALVLATAFLMDLMFYENDSL